MEKIFALHIDIHLYAFQVVSAFLCMVYISKMCVCMCTFLYQNLTVLCFFIRMYLCDLNIDVYFIFELGVIIWCSKVNKYMFRA